MHRVLVHMLSGLGFPDVATSDNGLAIVQWDERARPDRRSTRIASGWMARGPAFEIAVAADDGPTPPRLDR